LFDFGDELSNKNTCIYIRNKYKIKIPDAIIAATAIEFNIPLLTSDQGFEKVKELDLIYIQNKLPFFTTSKYYCTPTK